MKPNSEFFKFIEDNRFAEPASLILKYNNIPLPFDLRRAVLQIDCRKRGSKKLPGFLNLDTFIFPSVVASEQATDHRIAAIHSDLIGSGQKVIDMTAGLGIDAMCIAHAGNNVTALELDSEKAETLEYNAREAKIDNIKVINTDSVAFLLSRITQADVIYIDPARRSENNSRLYSFKDCSPDLLSIYDELVGKATRVFIKASPMLDITQVAKELPDLSELYIICLRGECKEILAILKKGGNFNSVSVIDIPSAGEPNKIEIPQSALGISSSSLAEINEISEGKYLYEPNAGIMKLHVSEWLCSSYPDLKKISPSTELFISDRHFPLFPGRIIKIESQLKHKDLKKLKGLKANVVVRNYPQSAEMLKKRLGIKEGTTRFIFGMRVGKKELPMLITGNSI